MCARALDFAALPASLGHVEEEFDFPAPGMAEVLTIAIDGWEGPLDLLLDLARRQKVDLRRISILELVDQ